jgi:glyoxylate/hydroxypyruvate reductase
MRIFVYTDLTTDVQEYLKNRLPGGYTVDFHTSLNKEDAQSAFLTADIVLGNPPAAWFKKMPHLVFWQIDSAGFDKYSDLTVKAAIANMGDFFARPCAETMVGGVLAFYRGIHRLAKLQTLKTWEGKNIQTPMRLLGDQQVIILGAGAIAQYIKDMLQGFDCPVRMTARTNPAAAIRSYEELFKALPQTSLVINTLPGSAGQYVDARFIETMATGSVYASVGRGETTDEAALIKALQSGKLAGAVLDVTEKEPLPADSPLWEMENVLLTQHTGGRKKDEFKGIVDVFITNLKRFAKGEAIQNKVELARGY